VYEITQFIFIVGINKGAFLINKDYFFFFYKGKSSCIPKFINCLLKDAKISCSKIFKEERNKAKLTTGIVSIVWTFYFCGYKQVDCFFMLIKWTYGVIVAALD
jgi:hypothetical protein